MLEKVGMKKKGILGAIVIALLCTGCVHKLNVKLDAILQKVGNVGFRMFEYNGNINISYSCVF